MRGRGEASIVATDVIWIAKCTIPLSVIRLIVCVKIVQTQGCKWVKVCLLQRGPNCSLEMCHMCCRDRVRFRDYWNDSRLALKSSNHLKIKILFQPAVDEPSTGSEERIPIGQVPTCGPGLLCGSKIVI